MTHTAEDAFSVWGSGLGFKVLIFKLSACG